jgi:hypothetical protein
VGSFTGCITFSQVYIAVYWVYWACFKDSASHLKAVHSLQQGMYVRQAWVVPCMLRPARSCRLISPDAIPVLTEDCALAVRSCAPAVQLVQSPAAVLSVQCLCCAVEQRIAPPYRRIAPRRWRLTRVGASWRPGVPLKLAAAAEGWSSCMCMYMSSLVTARALLAAGASWLPWPLPLASVQRIEQPLWAVGDVKRSWCHSGVASAAFHTVMVCNWNRFGGCRKCASHIHASHGVHSLAFHLDQSMLPKQFYCIHQTVLCCCQGGDLAVVPRCHPTFPFGVCGVLGLWSLPLCNCWHGRGGEVVSVSCCVVFD